ncbi:hypothetical protein ACFVUS_09405 [Nocardia sp. NPDC058058]|uniref:hypothetical protein n=1 Tax=Nocardia sp. NPDC058058 TaxID=3346317 RepID=UPI0036DB9ADD
MIGTATGIGQQSAAPAVASWLPPSDSGQRPRGAWVTGSFRAAHQATRLSVSALFDGNLHEVTACFSSARDWQTEHDADTGCQVFSVRIHLPSGAADLITHTVPGFRAQPTNEPMEPVVLVPLASPRTAPSGYTGLRYHSTHAFGLIDGNGRTHWARLEWRPVYARKPLPYAQARALPHNYLTQGLATVLPARFNLCAMLAKPGDDVHNPAAVWAETGLRRLLGTLAVHRTRESPCPQPDFDALRLPPGIAPPRDLLIRRRAARPH